MKPRFHDAHSHLHDEWLRPHLPRVMDDLAAAGVAAVVVNGTSEADWPVVAELCQAGPTRGSDRVRLRPSFGLHPWDVGNRSPDWQRKLLAQLEASPGAAIGEIGLDKWILERAKRDDRRLTGLRRAPLEEQTDAFRWQLTIAAERNLPASVHCLDAFGALHDVLRASPRPARGFLLHAYAGSAEMVTAFARLGAYFSFNGAFLEPRKRRLREVYAAIPADRLLVETDAPAMRLPAEREAFSLPVNAEGEIPNHPANIVAAYDGLAEWRKSSAEELATQVERNFRALFGE